jgi:hypothetical protein
MSIRKYSDIREELKVGDVIAFSGKGRVSNLIKFATRSDISHVGIVLESNSPELGHMVHIIESTSIATTPDIITKELFKGVQIQQLSRRIEHADGQVYHCPLKRELEECQRIRMVDWLRYKHTERTPYDTIQALGSGLDLLDGLGLENEPDFSSLFCSELVAKAYQVAGILSKDINPSEQTPEDIMNLDILERGSEIIL